MGYGAALEAANAGDDKHAMDGGLWGKSVGSTASGHSAYSCRASRRDSPIHLSTIGRREVLAWLNDALDLSLSAICQVQSGAVACQMLDRLHPGVLPMKKVDFNANTEWLYQQNWRLFQRALVELDIRNYTFRWLKVRYEGWVDHVGVLPPYDAPKKRAATKTGDLKPSSGGTPLGSWHHVRITAKKVCADEPEDMLFHSPRVMSNKATEPQRESALALGSDAKKVNKHRSVHFGTDSKAVKSGFWSRFKNAIGGKAKANAMIPA